MPLLCSPSCKKCRKFFFFDAKSWWIQKKAIPLHPHSRQNIVSMMHGEMVEWSITPVLKTGVPRGTGGSNPSLSADEPCKSKTYRAFSLSSSEINPSKVSLNNLIINYRPFEHSPSYFLRMWGIYDYCVWKQINPVSAKHPLCS